MKDTRQYMKRITLLLGFMVSSLVTWAQVQVQFASPHLEMSDARIGHAQVQGSSMTLNYTIPTSISALKSGVEESFVLVSLDFGEQYTLGAQPFQVTLTGELTASKAGQVVATIPLNTMVSHKQPEWYYHDEIASEMKAAAWDEVKVSNVQLTYEDDKGNVLSGTDLTRLQDVIRLQMRWGVSYGIDVQTSSDAQVAAPTVTGLNSAKQTSRVLTFEWQTANDYPNYELQLLKLENEHSAYQNDKDKIHLSAEVDWSRALKVETQHSAKELTLTVAEGTGFYIWRVRPIGNYYKGGIGNSRNYGPWSSGLTSGASVNLQNDAITLSDAFYLQDPDDDINWVFSRVFSEAGKQTDGVRTKQGMTYADGLQNVKQSQSYLRYKDKSGNWVQKTMTSQSVLDYLGRPALSTIPVPEDGTLSGYKANFVQDENDSRYSAKNFDALETVDTPDPVKSDEGAYQYYSSTNSQEDGVPDAEGYPFSRVIFHPDGSGRVIEQSGVGKRHMIGEQSNDMGRTTRTFYSTPSDEELIRIFGHNAPVASSVLKMTVIDPNNIASLTYTTKNGKTIATALVGAIGESNLETLENGGPKVIHNSTIENMYQGEKLVSTTLFDLPEKQNVEFTYSMQCKTINWGCLTGGGCKYFLEFFLTNKLTGETYKSQIFKVNPGDETLCEENGGKITPNMSSINWIAVHKLNKLPTNNPPVPTSEGKFELDAGTYAFTKVLSSEINKRDFLKTEVENYANEMTPLLNSIATQMDKITNAESHQAFTEWAVALVQDINNQHAANAIAGLGDYRTEAYQKTFELIEEEYELDPKCIFNPAKVLSMAEITGDDNEKLDQFTFASSESCCDNESVNVPRPEECTVCEELKKYRGNLDISKPEDRALLEPFWDNLYNAVYEAMFPFKIEENSEGEEIKIPVTRELVVKEIDEFIVPGFIPNSGKVNERVLALFQNMINSNYYTGKSKKDDEDGLWYKAESDGAGGVVFSEPKQLITEENPYNYDVDHLWKVWNAAIQTYLAANPKPTNGEAIDVYQETNNSAGDEGENDTSGDHYDESAKEEQKGFKDKVINFIVSRKMRKFSRREGKQDVQADVYNSINVYKLFMDAVGVQYAAIVDGQENQYGEVWPTEMGFKTNMSHSDWTSEYNQAPKNMASPLRLRYPLVLKPEWGFKYFHYDADDFYPNNEIKVWIFGNYNEDIIPNYINLEMNFCYNELDYTSGGESENGEPVVDYCNSVDCKENHLNWNSDQRLAFYELVRGYRQEAGDETYYIYTVDYGSDGRPILKTESITLSIDEDPITETLADRDLFVEAKHRIQQVRTSLSDRASIIKEEIIDMLLDNCYTIALCDDSDDPYVLTYTQVDEMVKSVLVEANKRLDVISENLNPQGNDVFNSAYGYPQATAESCKVRTALGDIVISDLTLLLFDDCDFNIINQIDVGNFIPAMDKNPDCELEYNKPKEFNWDQTPFTEGTTPATDCEVADPNPVTTELFESTYQEN